MIFAISAVLLFVLLIVYFRIADHYNIIDKPNNRSSHTTVTIRGGGIVFPLALIAYILAVHKVNYYISFGILLISIVSFVDDIKSLPNKLRIFIHLICVTALLFAVNAFAAWPIWLVAIACILIIGSINAYNFMDGINGITGLYSLTCLATLLYVNREFRMFSDDSFILFPIIACVVFLYFNLRKKARCFAGDVGSVSIGFWVVALILLAIIASGEIKYILFLAVYGVDSVLTILHRLILRQNIFEAHRLHFYQILANEKKLSHVLVAGMYALVQLIVNIFLLTSNFSTINTFIFVLLPLALLYLIAKPKLMPVRLID